MNEFLVAFLMRESAREEPGLRIRELIRGVAERCAEIAAEQGDRAPEFIRQQFVYPTPTKSAEAARVVFAKAN